MIASILLLVSQGCGESKQDLFLKHAMRDRGGAAEPSADGDAAAEDPAASDAANDASAGETATIPAELPAANVPAVDAAKPAAVDVASGNGPGPSDSALAPLSIAPISERVPERELTEVERRRKAFDNLQKINDALLTYVQQKGYYPRTYATNAGGVPTLSWRVELLPYLGYEDLYKRFDLSRAWNMSPNKELLEFIPDEYVSPERFDTKTNYQLAADSMFIFGDNRVLRPSMIDDGAENTIMLLEVNDESAVVWTEPKDFAPTPLGEIDKKLGGLRVDGTFALWASGFPVLLEKSLTNVQLIQAMTYKKSDGARASEIHRPITVAEAEPDPEIAQELPDSNSAPESESNPVILSQDLPMAVEDQSIQREPVPPAPELAAAQDKLRSIYRESLQDAKTATDKAKLAEELLSAASAMEADPAGAYTLQFAALRLAIEASDGALLIRAIDQRVARFEVDAFQENLKWIQEFGDSIAGRDSSTLKGDELLKRAVPVIYAGIDQNEFMLASSVARIAARFTGSSRDDETAKLLMRLRTHLGAAKREYDKSVEDLHRYRINPEDQAAGTAFGCFLCFIKGDWHTGLELIANGAPSDLTDVARLDMRGASRGIDQAAIGDAWWDLSRRGSGAYRQGAEDRAVLWYSQALERLPESLDRIHVENRLKEAADAEGRSPIALCIQLAESLNVDLSQGLTSIAAASRRGN